MSQNEHYAQLLSVRDLSVTFDGTTVLKNVSFDVNREEVLAVIGPNGSGKSVLLKTLVGIYTHTEGSIHWAPGIRIGYLPQRFHIDRYLPMTVTEFLDLKPHHDRTPEEALALVGLDAGWGAKRIAHLSGGELQKALLAWAIIDNPQILLFDEPTENVDVVGQQSIYRLLHELQDATGVALIIVSHDLHVVYRYATTVMCLNNAMICYGEPHATLTKDTLTEVYGEHALFHHDHGKHVEHHHAL